MSSEQLPMYISKYHEDPNVIYLNLHWSQKICDEQMQIRIDELEIKRGDISFGDLMRVLERAIEMMFDNKQPGVPGYNALVYLPSCWKPSPDAYAERSSNWVPCLNEYCCAAILTWTLNECGILKEGTYHISNVSVVSQHEDCKLSEPEVPCHFVCDALFQGQYPRHPMVYGSGYCATCMMNWNNGAILSSRLIDINDPTSLMNVWYSYRTCHQDATNEMIILAVHTPNTSSYSEEEMYKEAIKNILSKAILIFDSQDLTVRLLTSACWNSEEDPASKRLQACYNENAECCSTYYHIMYDNNQNMPYVENHWRNFDDNCRNCPPNHLEPENCNICFCEDDDVFNMQDFLYKPQMHEINIDNESTTIKPNPTTGVAELTVNHSETGSITVYITNLQGIEVLRADAVKTADIFNYTFDTQNFANGLYNYIVIINGKPISSGKFLKQ